GRQELHRATLEASDRYAARSLEIPLPETGNGEVVFTVEGPAEASAVDELLWIDPIVLEPRRDAPKNLVIVCIDTLRADRFAAIGGGPSKLPRTERRLETAAVFRRAYSNAPWTLPSVATVV